MAKERISAIRTRDVLNASSYKAGKIVMKVTELQSNPQGNAFIQLKEWKKLGDEIISYFYAYGMIMDKVSTSYSEFENATARNSNARWTKEEDEILIEMVCKQDGTIYELASTFGRTIPAIKTRVSKLVGLKRLSAEVAGQFIGTLDGEVVEGKINGTVYKE